MNWVLVRCVLGRLLRGAHGMDGITAGSLAVLGSRIGAEGAARALLQQSAMETGKGSARGCKSTPHTDRRPGLSSTGR
jgi:hypothetical protein